MVVCGPNNLGLINFHDRVALWSAHRSDAHAGGTAVVSQSGSVALALADDPFALGLSYVITAGNEAVCGVADYVDYLADDDRVSTILLFLETIREPAELARAAIRARTANKRLFAVKVGRSERARAAVAAHSGALSGEDVVVDAFLRKHGIERCVDLDDMVQRAALARKLPPAESCSAAYVTLSGGQAAAIADYASDVDIDIANLSAETADSLSPLFWDHSPATRWTCGAWAGTPNVSPASWISSLPRPRSIRSSSRSTFRQAERPTVRWAWTWQGRPQNTQATRPSSSLPIVRSPASMARSPTSVAKTTFPFFSASPAPCGRLRPGRAAKPHRWNAIIVRNPIERSPRTISRPN
ncbi:hypothetical protein FJU11_17915 [Pararhizobium mangrovi]|uniref:Succinyl-CoA synthetase-like flavodoxin domain-containing protein n=1 Tax=Pararhizobium mangrovi TaxID=2590452 RepID=A0A506TUN2_9HYPH|nr:hypothetical protein FJU11_17915 [Pararhizobium mangrovi]